MQTTLEVADPLQLRTAYDTRVASPALDWEFKLHERYLNYFQAPSDGAHALNSFLVMQVSRRSASVGSEFQKLTIGKHTGHAAFGSPRPAPDQGGSPLATRPAHANAGPGCRGNGGIAAFRSARRYRLRAAGWAEQLAGRVCGNEWTVVGAER